MLRRIFVIALACMLSGCASTIAGIGGPEYDAARPPRPAEGLWAILDPGCAKPARIDTHTWPHCASPIWVSHASVLVVGARTDPKGKAPSASYRADLRITPGKPFIVQAGTPRDGYIFLALDKIDRDAAGRLIGATGAAFACRGEAPGPISLKPNTGGCELASLEDMRKAALETLHDESALSSVVWIAPGAP